MKMKKRFGIIVLLAARHGWRHLHKPLKAVCGALGGVYVKRKLRRVVLAGMLILLAGCPTTKAKTKNAGDDVGSAAVGEATDAVSDNVRKEVRDGVNDAWKDLFD